MLTLIACSLLQPETAAPAQLKPREPIPEVQALLAEVSVARIRSTIDSLVSFGTRHTLSDTQSPTRGIGAARTWILSQFQQAGGRLQPAFDEYIAPVGRRVPEPVPLVNVMATLRGTMPEAAHRVYYVVGHYDSRASDVMDITSNAPGANDDGSGTTVVIELARVLAHAELDSTIVFLATAGEEQGLLGAAAHARAAREKGVNIAGVLSCDIVGDPTGAGGRESRAHIRLFSEGLELGPLTIPQDEDERARQAAIAAMRQVRALGAESDSPSRTLARFIAEVAPCEKTQVQPLLIFRPDRFLRGGDHTAFSEQGFPAVRFTQVHENYNRQHQDVRTEDGVEYGDTPPYVDEHYLAGVTRLNLAALVHLANAPSPPPHTRILAGQLVYDTTLRWDRSPEPDVAGYEVVWRRTTSPVWEFVLDVGDATEATIDLSKDDWFFAVRAYDDKGYRSPVAMPLPANE